MKRKTAKRRSTPATVERAKSTAGKVGSAIASTKLSSPLGRARDKGAHSQRGILRYEKHGRGPGAGCHGISWFTSIAWSKSFSSVWESSRRGFDWTLRDSGRSPAQHPIEEELFYPAVRKANPDLIDRLEEHAMGRFALRRLLGTEGQ